MTVNSISALDTEESGGQVQLFSGGAGSNLLGTVDIPVTADGGIQTVPVDVSGVDYMEETLGGSGAIDNIDITAVAPRMTGGGSVFDASGVRFTHGFELFCSVSHLPNNLEINWPDATGKGSNHFHLTTLNTATCTGTDLEGKPVAGFDTYVGTGIGLLNESPGIPITFTLTDFGEPGKDADIAEFDIDSGTVVGPANTLDC